MITNLCGCLTLLARMLLRLSGGLIASGFFRLFTQACLFVCFHPSVCFCLSICQSVCLSVGESARSCLSVRPFASVHSSACVGPSLCASIPSVRHSFLSWFEHVKQACMTDEHRTSNRFRPPFIHFHSPFFLKESKQKTSTMIEEEIAVDALLEDLKMNCGGFYPTGAYFLLLYNIMIGKSCFERHSIF